LAEETEILGEIRPSGTSPKNEKGEDHSADQGIDKIIILNSHCRDKEMMDAGFIWFKVTGNGELL
jgi:hypothetical protein